MAQEDRKLFWGRENEVSEEWIEFVDENVLASKAEPRRSGQRRSLMQHFAELPPGTQTLGIFPHGASYWTRTAEIETEQEDGSPQSFFIKVGFCRLHFG